MMPVTTLLALTLLALTGSTALALSPSDELWIRAAARGAGQAGSSWFTGCLVVHETSPLDPVGLVDTTVYAPHVGLVDDAGLTLVSYTDSGNP